MTIKKAILRALIFYAFFLYGLIFLAACRSDENEYYLFGVVVAKAGVLLKADEYILEKKNSDSSLNEVNFPKIGKRAKKEPGRFGPGGSSNGLVFTTTDGLFDVKIVISMLLPENVDSPNIDIRQAARTISNTYDEHLRKN